MSLSNPKNNDGWKSGDKDDGMTNATPMVLVFIIQMLFLWSVMQDFVPFDIWWTTLVGLGAAIIVGLVTAGYVYLGSFHALRKVRRGNRVGDTKWGQ